MIAFLTSLFMSFANLIQSNQFVLGAFSMQLISSFNALITIAFVTLKSSISSFLFSKTCHSVAVLKESPLYNVVRRYLSDCDNKTSSNLIVRCVDKDISFVSGDEPRMWFSFQGVWIFISYEKDKDITLTVFIWNRHVLKILLEDAVRKEKVDAIQKETVSVKLCGSYSIASKEIPRRFTSGLFLPKGQMAMIMDRIELFVKQRDFYAFNNIPYHLGILLHGLAGSGKSSLVKAIASRFSFEIVVVGKLEALRDVPQKTHHIRIVLIEEIDSLIPKLTDTDVKADDSFNNPGFMDRIDKRRKHHDNFSYLLNFIDGVGAEQGQIVIMTTNNVQDLDPVLIRPGRVDMSIEFKAVDVDQLARAIDRFYFASEFATSDKKNDSLEHVFIKERAARDYATLMLNELSQSKKPITMSAISQHFLENQASVKSAMENVNKLIK